MSVIICKDLLTTRKPLRLSTPATKVRRRSFNFAQEAFGMAAWLGGLLILPRCRLLVTNSSSMSALAFSDN